MRRAGVAQVRDQLSTYLRAAEAGEEVEITDHGRPIARLMAARATSDVAIRRASSVPDGRRLDYPAANWPRRSLDLLLEERQGR